MKILLLGANGQVGWELRRSLSVIGDVVACGRREANLASIDHLKKVLDDVQPQVIVNAAAYTNVDQAESEVELADLINGKAVGILADSTKKNGGLLVHYSTDYVYDGSKEDVYDESDRTAPLNMYGKSKLKGEEAIISSGCDHLIFRTSWVFDSRGKNFINTILRLASEDRSELKVVSDQRGAPTSAELIADVTAMILRQLHKNDERVSGKNKNIYHLVALGETNWCDYSKYILDVAKENNFTLNLSSDKISPIFSKDYPVPAQRPLNSRLSTEKLRNEFGLTLPLWHEHVKRAVIEILEKK